MSVVAVALKKKKFRRVRSQSSVHLLEKHTDVHYNKDEHSN